MSREWKPGDVAMVTVDYGKGARDVVCFRTPGWWRDSTTGGSYGSALREVKDARPLVVLDPEDREQVERLLKAYHAQYKMQWSSDTDEIHADNLQAALREIADPKPRIEEPTGLGAVVEDVEGVRWTRVESREAETRNPWYPADCDFQPDEWRNLCAVRVLSEGVS